MKQYLVKQKHHYGWTEDVETAENVLDAITKNVQRYHDFLEEYEFGTDYSVKHIKPGDFETSPQYEGYQVIWENKTPKSLALGRSVLKGEYWFADAIEVIEINKKGGK